MAQAVLRGRIKMESWEVDGLIAEIRRVTAEEDRAYQIDQLVKVADRVLAAATIKKVQDLLYTGESPADVDIAVRVSDHLRCVGAPFETWWKCIYPKLGELTDVRPLEKELDALRKQIHILDTEIQAIREKQNEVSAQEKKIRRREKDKCNAGAELLKREKLLRKADKDLAELTAKIGELKDIEARLAPDVAKKAFDIASSADRSSLAAFEKSVMAIAEHSRANRRICEAILKDDSDIVSALRSVEEQANSAELLDAGRLLDDARDAFGRYARAIEDLEGRIEDYLHKRDSVFEHTV